MPVEGGEGGEDPRTALTRGLVGIRVGLTELEASIGTTARRLRADVERRVEAVQAEVAGLDGVILSDVRELEAEFPAVRQLKDVACRGPAKLFAGVEAAAAAVRKILPRSGDRLVSAAGDATDLECMVAQLRQDVARLGKKASAATRKREAIERNLLIVGASLGGNVEYATLPCLQRGRTMVRSQLGVESVRLILRTCPCKGLGNVRIGGWANSLRAAGNLQLTLADFGLRPSVERPLTVRTLMNATDIPLILPGAWAVIHEGGWALATESMIGAVWRTHFATEANVEPGDPAANVFFRVAFELGFDEPSFVWERAKRGVYFIASAPGQLPVTTRALLNLPFGSAAFTHAILTVAEKCGDGTTAESLQRHAARGDGGT